MDDAPMTLFSAVGATRTIVFITVFMGICSSLGAVLEVDGSLTELRGRTMGTTYSVKVVDPDHRGPDRRRLAAQIEGLLDSINRRMSTYRPDSELMRLNAASSHRWIEVSTDLYGVLDEAILWSRRTNGAFDVTAGSLVRLWGFGLPHSAFQIPEDSVRQATLQRVGYRLLETRSSPPAIRKQRAGLFLDLSAIGKGYAVDQVFRMLRSEGVERCLVEIGGELRGLGRNAAGRPWSVAVQAPDGKGVLGRRILLSNAAAATSGDYRQFFEMGDRRYTHILDPRTGWPVQHDLVSVTVVDSSAMKADALATALMVLGPNEGYEFALREKVGGLFLVRDGEGFSELITPQFETCLGEEE